jgi:hypothetical protein
MERIENGLPFESWEQRSAKGAVAPAVQEVVSKNF